MFYFTRVYRIWYTPEYALLMLPEERKMRWIVEAPERPESDFESCKIPNYLHRAPTTLLLQRNFRNDFIDWVTDFHLTWEKSELIASRIDASSGFLKLKSIPKDLILAKYKSRKAICSAAGDDGARVEHMKWSGETLREQNIYLFHGYLLIMLIRRFLQPKSIF